MEDSGLNVEFYQNVFASPKDVFDRLENEITYLPSEEAKVHIKSKEHKIPRQVVAFGDPGLSYSFSGLTLPTNTWTPLLLEIKQIVEQLTGVSYNYVLLNRYRDGNDCIGSHRDDEKDLVPDHPIASLSLGQARTFQFKRSGHPAQTYELVDNSLLVMKPPTNKFWSHGIPRQKDRQGVRINLTFRQMVTPTTTMDNNHKRKAEPLVPDNAKRERSDGFFYEDAIPDHLTSLGDNVFVGPAIYKGHVSVHIRRYKKYGAKFYPTAEGVTLPTMWIDSLVYACPTTHQELCMIDLSGFTVETNDFQSFVLKRTVNDSEKTIQISANQWRLMSFHASKICSSVLDYKYSHMNLCEAYETVAKRTLDIHPPSTFDVAEGCKYLNELAKNTLLTCLKTRGDLKEPQLIDCEELCVHEVRSFNRVAFQLTVSEFVELFHENIDSLKTYLSYPIEKFVTKDFFNNLRLGDLLSETREVFCPTDLSKHGATSVEYYECLLQENMF